MLAELDQGSQLVVHLDADLADVPGILAAAILEVLDCELRVVPTLYGQAGVTPEREAFGFLLRVFKRTG